MTSPSQSGRQLLVAAAGGRLGLLLLNTVLSRLFSWQALTGLEWVFMAVDAGIIALIVLALAQLRGELRHPEVAWIAAGLAILVWLIDLGFRLALLVPPVSGEPAFTPVMRAASAVAQVVIAAADGLLLWVLVSLGAERRAWVRPLAAVAGLAVAVRTLLWVAVTAQLVPEDLSFSAYRHWISMGGIYLVRGAMFALSLGTLGAPGGAVATGQEGGVSAGRDLVIGGALLALGLGGTLLSYSLVSGSGGKYVVATGAIAVGLGRIIRGLIRLSRSPAPEP